MIYFLTPFFLSLFSTLAVRKVAFRLGVVDVPDGGRKRHPAPVPLLGGVALFLSFWIVTLYLLLNPARGVELLTVKLAGAFFASLVLVVVGIADEARPFSAGWRFILTAAAIAVAVSFGISLEKITNPFGGFINLSVGMPKIGGLSGILSLSDLFAFFWLMGMTYTTKILDGLDGLASGIVLIGSLMIYFLTRTATFYQPNVGLVALIFAGVISGFLIFNFHPAKIYLGESGGLFAGFMLGVLSIISGSKIATALLVMAVPILDLARVIFIRFKNRQPIFKGDRSHLHFQLLDFGLSERQAVLFFYAIAAVFGAITLFLQSAVKLAALLFLLIAMIVFAWKFKGGNSSAV